MASSTVQYFAQVSPRLLERLGLKLATRLTKSAQKYQSNPSECCTALEYSNWRHGPNLAPFCSRGYVTCRLKDGWS